MKGQCSSLKIVTMAKLITLSVQLIIPNYLVILSHQHSTSVSSETYSLIHLILYFIYLLFKKQFDFFAICDQTQDVTCDATHDVTHDPPHVPILDPIHDLMQSDPVYDPGFVNTAVVSTSLSTLSHNYFCMYMYLIIAVRFRC